jgi:hypothetical protein
VSAAWWCDRCKALVSDADVNRGDGIDACPTCLYDTEDGTFIEVDPDKAPGCCPLCAAATMTDPARGVWCPECWWTFVPEAYFAEHPPVAPHSEVRKIAAWIPVTEELQRWFDPEPVHVEGGRCLLMAAAYGARPFSDRGKA